MMSSEGGLREMTPEAGGSASPSQEPKKRKAVERGKACLSCRQRKLKCDAQEPSCGACIKARVVHGTGEEGYPCVYERLEPGQKRRRISTKKLEDLERNVDLLMGKLRSLGGVVPEEQENDESDWAVGVLLKGADSASYQLPIAPMQSVTATPPPPLPVHQPPAFDVSATVDPPVVPFDYSFSLSSTSYSLTDLGAFSLSPPSMPPPAPTAPVATGDSAAAIQLLDDPTDSGPMFTTKEEFAEFAAHVEQLLKQAPSNAPIFSFGDGANITTPPFGFGELAHNDWPTFLPPLPIMRTIVALFFRSQPLAAIFLNHGRLLSCLEAGPRGDSREAWSNAVWAGIVATVVEERGVGPLEGWTPRGEGHAVMTKGEGGEGAKERWFYDRCREESNKAVEKNEGLYGAIKGMMLLVFWCHRTARFNETWHDISLIVRLTTLLRLHLPATVVRNNQLNTSVHARPTGSKWELGPPATEEEAAERTAIAWFVYGADAYCCANTTWAQCMGEDVIGLCPLPALNGLSPRLIPANMKSCLDPRNTVAFLTQHPPSLVGPMQLFFKAVWLLHRTTRFVRRLPPPIGRRFVEEGFAFDGRDILNSREFQQICADVDMFIESLPKEYENPIEIKEGEWRMGGMQVPSFPLVIGIPHVCRIILYEHMCKIDPFDRSLEQCLKSARAILATVARKDWSGMSLQVAPFLSFTWVVAARVFLKEIAIHDAVGSHPSEKHHALLAIENICRSLASFAMPYASNCSQQLKLATLDPSVALPDPGLFPSDPLPDFLKASITDLTYNLPSTSPSVATSLPNPSTATESSLALLEAESRRAFGKAPITSGGVPTGQGLSGGPPCLSWLEANRNA